MKKINNVFYFVLVACLYFISCNDNYDDNKNSTFRCNVGETTEIKPEHIDNIKMTILTIDSCEYIFVIKGYAGGLTHKSNCKNPIHNCN